MLKNDQREFPRFNPKGLTAHVTLEHDTDEQIEVTGEILDISYSGIRLKLTAALPVTINDKLKIKLILPESGIPLTISGVIKHEISELEFGLHYDGPTSKSDYHEIVLECFKLPQVKF
ncbi:MAG: PilZ domain-containing protein [Methylococcaceae bacterium]|nr:PilZ domain-containing protein [Methylococcaceae bacterium]